MFVHLDPCLNPIAQHRAIQSDGLVTNDFRGCLAVLGVVDDTGNQVLSRKLVNDEQPIGALIAEIDLLGQDVSWTAI